MIPHSMVGEFPWTLRVKEEVVQGPILNECLRILDTRAFLTKEPFIVYSISYFTSTKYLI